VSEPLPVKVTPRAEKEILKADAWWRKNRESAPEALSEELANALRLIAFQPHIGARATNAKLTGVHRIHLSRVHYHLYYRVRPDQAAIEILAFWHGRRREGPRV
jgi:plasmid stabilization system protein ParE